MEVYEFWGCGACVAACSRGVYAIFVDYCDGGSVMGGGSGEGEEGGE